LEIQVEESTAADGAACRVILAIEEAAVLVAAVSVAVVAALVAAAHLGGGK
jgi:hypothetical protein